MKQSQGKGKGKEAPYCPRFYPGEPPRPVWWEEYPRPEVVQACRRYLWLERDHLGRPVPIMVADGRWLVAYLQYWIDCPRPEVPESEIRELRRRAGKLFYREEVGDFLQDCLAVGLDIFGQPG